MSLPSYLPSYPYSSIRVAMQATKDIGRSTAAKLARATQFELRKAIIEDLLSKHWDINQPLDKDTPPVMSFLVNDLTTVKWLLEQGALPNVPAQSGNTPLSIAVASAPIEVIRTLVQASASDLSTGDLIYCAVLRWEKEKDEKTALEIIRMLVEAGTPVNKILWDNDPAYQEKAHFSRGTALHEACRQGWKQGVTLLLEYGADPDKPKQTLREDTGGTPREIAQEQGQYSILEIMQDYGQSAGRGWRRQ